jgi:ribosome-binding protein aMBF1 (putative translation factor)
MRKKTHPNLEEVMNQNNQALLSKVKESGWSIEELAGLTRIPEIVIYDILAGRHDAGLAVLNKFALVLGCSVEELSNGS